MQQLLLVSYQSCFTEEPFQSWFLAQGRSGFTEVSLISDVFSFPQVSVVAPSPARHENLPSLCSLLWQQFPSCTAALRVRLRSLECSKFCQGGDKAVCAVTQSKYLNFVAQKSCLVLALQISFELSFPVLGYNHRQFNLRQNNQLTLYSAEFNSISQSCCNCPTLANLWDGPYMVLTWSLWLKSAGLGAVLQCTDSPCS